MEDVSGSVLTVSKKALQSAVGKSKRALAQMTQKGANTSLLVKRLKALSISLIVLENEGKHLSTLFSHSELAETRSILINLLISIEHIYQKSKLGSSQRTLLEKRILAMNLVIQMIDENQ
jgi:hypothetical protein